MGVYWISTENGILYLQPSVGLMALVKKETTFSNADNAVENKVVAFELPAVSAERELLAA